MDVVIGGPDVKVRVIRVVRGCSRTSTVTLRFMPRAGLSIQQVRL